MTQAAILMAVVIGGVGVFLALPRGRANPGYGALIVLAGAAALLVTALLNRGSGDGQAAWFAGLSIIALAGAIRVITHTRPVYSALYFVLVIIAVAGLLVLAQAEFLAAALVIIYAGAIIVTYVFVIMLAQQGGEAGYDRQAREPLLATAAGFVLLGVIGSQLFAGPAISVGNGATSIDSDIASPETGQRADEAPGSLEHAQPASGGVTAVGTHLLTRYALGVELAGVLLLAAMVGALAIAKRRPAGLAEEES